MSWTGKERPHAEDPRATTPPPLAGSDDQHGRRRPAADAGRPAPAGLTVLSVVPQGLRYVDDGRPGITRRLLRGRFAYFDPKGERIRDADTVARLNALAIPPAYTDVWICPDPRGHIQATARDARGRKQYRYHPLWRETRDATKYERMLAFGRALPVIRARIDRDLALPGMPREKVLATVIRLLDATLIRVGNTEYARANRSYGLTTLRNRHAKVEGGSVRFRFRGKSGVDHDVTVRDPRIARIVRRCMDLPGQELFQWMDADGTPHAVGSADVNDWLRETAGESFTAKDYRTWNGSALALARLREAVRDDADGGGEGAADPKRRLTQAVEEVARRLRNTPAVCRRCYIHPAVVDGFLAGELASLVDGPPCDGLRPEEVALLAFLEAKAAPAS